MTDIRHCTEHGGHGFVSDCIICKQSSAFNAPWMSPPLNEWALVGMNHYHVGSKRQLFVSMTKDGRCIKAEGEDDKYLWNRLWHQATEE